MKVLVTRPAEDAGETARKLSIHGHEALVAPILATRYLEGAPLSLDGVQAILATSANGVRALARRTARRDVPVFAVGPQTTAMAMKAGFVSVRDGDGDAKKLAEATVLWAKPGAGSLLHVHGGKGAGALAAELRDKGFSVREEILYDVAPQALAAEAVTALRDGAIGAALFYSPRSAALFKAQAHQLALPTAGVIAICISPPTAAALAPLAFREIRVAAKPNQAALLACLEPPAANTTAD
jgi:uroporphyrinogen-III synthase